MKTADRIRIAACWSGWMHWQAHTGDTTDDYFARGRMVVRVVYDARGGIQSAHRWNRDRKSVSRLRRHIPNKVNRVLEWLGA